VKEKKNVEHMTIKKNVEQTNSSQQEKRNPSAKGH